jgi:hypothetical protein
MQIIPKSKIYVSLASFSLSFHVIVLHGIPCLVTNNLFHSRKVAKGKGGRGNVLCRITTGSVAPTPSNIPSRIAYLASTWLWVFKFTLQQIYPAKRDTHKKETVLPHGQETGCISEFVSPPWWKENNLTQPGTETTKIASIY